MSLQPIATALWSLKKPLALPEPSIAERNIARPMSYGLFITMSCSPTCIRFKDKQLRHPGA